MLKRLKLKSLLPSSALRSNSAALRLSKTPPQGGVFVSGAELFPGWRLTPYPGYKCSKASLRAAKPNTALARSPGQQRATGGQTLPVPQTGHQPPKASLRAAEPKHRTRRSPGQRRATGGQTVPVPQTGHQPPKASLRAANPNTALARSPGQQRASGGQTLPVPQTGHQPP